MSDVVRKQLTERYNETSFLNLRRKIRLWRGKRHWTSRYNKRPQKWIIQFHKWNRERKSYYHCKPEKSWSGKIYTTHSFSCGRKDGYKMGVVVPYFGAVPFKIGRFRTNLWIISKIKDKIKYKLGWAIPHAHADMWVCTVCGVKAYFSPGEMHYDWERRKPIGCKITHRIPSKHNTNSGIY